MENQRPLILVSNDDGIIAKGISELIKFLRPLGEIVVMAPVIYMIDSSSQIYS